MAANNHRIGIVVGEASGDQLAAPVVEALKERYPDSEILGIAGPKMISAGCASLYNMERLSVMGFGWQVISRIWELYKLRRFLVNTFVQKQVDLFIGVDAPAFNIGLEEKLRARGIKTLHYISPSVWAWRAKRIHKIKRAVDMMLVMLPFELKIYHQHEIPVRFIGHPLADKFPLEPNVELAKEKLGLQKSRDYIALLPGSRQSEVELISEDLLIAANILSKKLKDVGFLVPMINEKRARLFKSLLKNEYAELDLQVLIGKSHEVMAAAKMVILSSGTATLEALLLKKPMVVAYRFTKLSYWIASKLVSLPYVSLPNLLLGREVVDELIQDDLDGVVLAQKAYDLWCDSDRQAELKKMFFQVHKELKQSATDKFVKSVVQMLEGVEPRNA